MSYDRLYVLFMYYFNVERNYFECHEVMEELWLEEGRKPLYQGLLQVAVGLYHHFNGNPNGSVKLFTAAVDKLQSYPSIVEGIRLDKVLADSNAYLARLHRLEQEPFAPYDLDIEIVDEELRLRVEELRSHPPKDEDE